MTATEMAPVVVIIAVQGGVPQIRASLSQAREQGLEAVVFTTRDAARRTGGSLRSDELSRVVEVPSYPLRGVRGSIRRTLMSFASSLSAILYRAARAARHRLSLPEPANDVLVRVGSAGKSRFPTAATAIADRVVEPALRVAGFLATKTIHWRVIGGEMRRVVANRNVVGVACLDDGSLLPGWLIARRYPMLAVVAGYPGRWELDLEEKRDLFERGDTW